MITRGSGASAPIPGHGSGARAQSIPTRSPNRCNRARGDPDIRFVGHAYQAKKEDNLLITSPVPRLDTRGHGNARSANQITSGAHREAGESPSGKTLKFIEMIRNRSAAVTVNDSTLFLVLANHVQRRRRRHP